MNDSPEIRRDDKTMTNGHGNDVTAILTRR